MLRSPQPWSSVRITMTLGLSAAHSRPGRQIKASSAGFSREKKLNEIAAKAAPTHIGRNSLFLNEPMWDATLVLFVLYDTVRDVVLLFLFKFRGVAIAFFHLAHGDGAGGANA